MNATTTEAINDRATLQAWRDDIAETFSARIRRDGVGGLAVVALSFDGEYLRYFDRALDDLAANDDRLPHFLNPERTLLRSAAVEVVMGQLLERRRGEDGSPLTSASGDIANALTGNMQNIILSGFIERFEPASVSTFVSIDLLLSSETAKEIDYAARQAIQQAVAAEDRAFYLHDGFADVLSAFIEAGMMSWLVLLGDIEEDAVPARAIHAQSVVQHTASRRRRWFRGGV